MCASIERRKQQLAFICCFGLETIALGAGDGQGSRVCHAPGCPALAGEAPPPNAPSVGAGRGGSLAGMGRWLGAGLAVALLAVGCGAEVPLVTHRFEPYTARRGPDRSAEWAAVAYRGDVEALAAVGARPLGTLELTGAADDAALDARARQLGAEAGGTHVVPTARRDVTRTEVDEGATAAVAVGAGLKGAGDQVQCNGGNLYACFRETPRAATLYRSDTLRAADYLVVAVALERWVELPGELRPERLRPKARVPYHWVQSLVPGYADRLQWEWVPVDE